MGELRVYAPKSDSFRVVGLVAKLAVGTATTVTVATVFATLLVAIAGYWSLRAVLNGIYGTG